MSLEERDYSVLVVSAAEKFNTVISELLAESGYRQIRFESGVSAARRAFSENSFGFVIINSPLPDDVGLRFAIDVSASGSAVALLVVRSDIFEETNEKVYRHGVYSIPKPMSRPIIEMALKWMASSRERLRKSEKKTLSIEEKMEEIRMVNRAKWLLISEINMEEPGAHRYIEKQAMDRCVTRREIANEIIKTYS
ncbi:MAG: ANTAR domain-containing protein [Lachnospiraceae bacterium]|nr:ANTAR domain-containing protein [Lachnospiraceae bacterium]